MASEESRPLVSCVVATGDRPHFMAQLIRYFLRQTWPAKELIVVDSGRESVEHLCAGMPDVHHLRASAGTTLAERLNLGLESSRGTILQKLDDDDYYHREFLDRAVSTLIRSGTNSIVAWDCFHVVLKGEARLRFSGHGWAAGGTLCFPRELWERIRFRGGAPSDYFFINDSGAVLHRVCAPEMYLHVRHGGNMWQDLGSNGVDAHFRALPASPFRASDLVEPADAEFYAALASP
jgi:glycosyltransferase involved in cell wall biosynthesis